MLGQLSASAGRPYIGCEDVEKYRRIAAHHRRWNVRAPPYYCFCFFPAIFHLRDFDGHRSSFSLPALQGLLALMMSHNQTIREVFAADQPGVIGVVTFNGHVSTKDWATGQPVRSCLIGVSAQPEVFATFVLADLDPVACLHKLNARLLCA